MKRLVIDIDDINWNYDLLWYFFVLYICTYVDLAENITVEILKKLVVLLFNRHILYTFINNIVYKIYCDKSTNNKKKSHLQSKISIDYRPISFRNWSQPH